MAASGDRETLTGPVWAAIQELELRKKVSMVSEPCVYVYIYTDTYTYIWIRVHVNVFLSVHKYLHIH